MIRGARSARGWLRAVIGNSLHLIGRVLNHTNRSTTAVYTRFGEDQARQALNKHADRLTEVAGKRPGS